MTAPRHRSARHTGTARPVAGGPRLVWQQVAADPWVSVLLAVMVALIAFLATLVPRFTLEMNTAQIPHVLGGLSATQRDLIGNRTVTIQPDWSRQYVSTENTWGGFIQGMEQVRQDQPEPLRSLLGPGQFFVDLGAGRGVPADPDAQSVPDPEAKYASVEIQRRIDPFLEQHSRLVQGRWPVLVMNRTNDGAGFGNSGPALAEYQSGPIEVVILESAAERLGWQVGQEFQQFVLVGTYEPTDPGDGRWEHAPNSAALGELFDGNTGWAATVAAYLPGASPGTTGSTENLRMRLWFPLADGVGEDGSSSPRLRGDQVDLATAQLLGFSSAPQVIVPQVATVTFLTEATRSFRGLSSAQTASASILSVIAAGPVGVALATFGLAARLIVGRRRAALALATARGGSTAQIRSLLALEGLALGLPAAALGWWAAGAVRPVSTGWQEWVVAGLVAAVPALALGLSSGERSLRESRADLGPRSTSRLRWIGEALLVAVAGVAVWRLLDRGLAGVGSVAAGASGGAGAAGAGGIPGSAGAGLAGAAVDPGVDLLMAATPVLLALAACVITLRVYPVPVRALVAALRGRPGLTGFLGAARSVRDPAGGLIPALAVILGVAVAVFSAVMASTITRGAETAAWDTNGAQVKIAGPWLTPEVAGAVSAVEGVSALSPVAEVQAPADLTGGVVGRQLTVYVVSSSLVDVQASAPLVTPTPTAVFDPGATTAVLTGGALAATSGTGELSGLGPVRVVGHVDVLPGIRTPGSFLLVDRVQWEAAGGSVALPTVGLIAVADPASVAQVADRLRATVPYSVVTTPQQQLDTFRAAPVTTGLLDFFVAAVVFTALLTVLAILIVQLMGAPARTRLMAVLRTLGLERGQGRALTVWELAPLLVMAFAVGAVVGLTIPRLLLSAVDLTGMTGGDRQPLLSTDWTILGPVLGAILLTVAATVTVSAAVAARSDLARQLRIGEER